MYFIADAASNHEGNFDKAIKLIYKAKESGANAIKFQYFKASTLISKYGFEQIGRLSHQSTWPDVYQVYERYELPIIWIPFLRSKCDELGIEFMCSIYDIDDLDYINQFINIHKIGSGDITYYDMLDKINSYKKPVILAIGASTEKEVIEATKHLKDCELHLMQCNTNYEFNEKNIKHLDLSVIGTKINNVLIDGLSDHNKDIDIIKIAKLRGAKYIERHFRLIDNLSPDSHFSMMPNEWQNMIETYNNKLDINDKVKTMLGSDKKEVKPNELETRIIQRRCRYDVKGKTMWLRPDLVEATKC